MIEHRETEAEWWFVEHRVSPVMETHGI